MSAHGVSAIPRWYQMHAQPGRLGLGMLLVVNAQRALITAPVPKERCVAGHIGESEDNVCGLTSSQP